MMIAAVVSGCGSGDAKQNNSSNTAKQQEIEAENERLKAEAESLKKELADKEESENKETEQETEQTAPLAAEEQPEVKETSQNTKFADMMSQIVPYISGDGEIDEKTYNYIVDHQELFPAVTANSKKTAKEQTNPDITTRHLFKNITPYLDTMVEVSGYVVEIQEEETDYGTLAEIHIIDDNDNSIVGVYNNSTGDILDEDYVTLGGVPTVIYSFENVGGGTTNAILLAVSTIKKDQ